MSDYILSYPLLAGGFVGNAEKKKAVKSISHKYPWLAANDFFAMEYMYIMKYYYCFMILAVLFKIFTHM